MAGLTDKQVKLKFSKNGTTASTTSNNGDIVFDSKNKKIYARGTVFDGNDSITSSVNGLSGGTISSDVSVSGTVTSTGFYESSDINLKKNIQDISTYTNIPEIHSFEWKLDGKKSYGFIAQELETNYPELIAENSDGSKVVNYDAALALVVGKLMKKIEYLENEISALKNQKG